MEPPPFAIIQRERTDPDFYALMGPLFGSRAIARELGMPMYDDPGRIWCIAIDDLGAVIGCGSIAISGHKAALKSAWVAPEWRGKGIYNDLFRARLAIATERHVSSITATATRLSRNTHLRHNFRQTGTRGKYFLMRKDTADVH